MEISRVKSKHCTVSTVSFFPFSQSQSWNILWGLLNEKGRLGSFSKEHFTKH